MIFQMSLPANFPKKWFSIQNKTLDVRFQIGLIRNKELFISEKNKQIPWFNLLKCCIMAFA